MVERQLITDEKLLELHQIVQGNLPTQGCLLQRWRQERLLARDPTATILVPRLWYEAIMDVGRDLGEAIGLDNTEKTVLSAKFLSPVLQKFKVVYNEAQEKETKTVEEGVLSLPYPKDQHEKILQWIRTTEEGGQTLGRLFVAPTLEIPLAQQTLQDYEKLIKQARPPERFIFPVDVTYHFRTIAAVVSPEQSDYYSRPKQVSEEDIANIHSKIQSGKRTFGRVLKGILISRLTGGIFDKLFSMPRYLTTLTSSGVKLGHLAGLNDVESYTFGMHFLSRTAENYLAGWADQVDYYPRSKREITDDLTSGVRYLEQIIDNTLNNVSTAVLDDDPAIDKTAFDAWLSSIKNSAGILGSFFYQSELDARYIQTLLLDSANKIVALRIDSPRLHLFKVPEELLR